MKIIIFGATGSIGCNVVEQALEKGHQVTAFARNPSALEITHSNLFLVKGDVLNKEDVTNALTDQDAVIITLGAGSKGDIRAPGTHNIVEGMKQSRIKRLVCLSTIGAGDSYHLLNFFWKYIMFGLLLRKALADHELQEKIVNNSGLDWIVVRPGAFMDGPLTGEFKHGSFDSKEKIQLKVSRSDIADFIISCLNDDTYLNKMPSLSY